jgi:hypothetical protein
MKRFWIRSRFLRFIREKIDDGDDDDDDEDDVGGAFPFPRRRIVFNSGYSKNIQDSLHSISVTSVVVSQKFVRAQ